jgi:D-alanyl-D-alanine carboxypeptidase/D-alanyl-D-alanine-endopeptidase (penicillin-binding protein 4)
VKQINKPSQNLYAELLFKTLGAQLAGEGSARAAAGVMAGTLSDWGIPSSSIVIQDGSGLSRMNLVSPEGMVSLLAYMYRQPDFRVFHESLPQAGREGTLARRMRFTEAEGQVRAKTGTLTHHINLSGYITMPDGEVLAFAIMNNNSVCPLPEVRRLQDEFCLQLLHLAR